jgi:hypothetical protein
MNKEEINKMLFDACSNLDTLEVLKAIEMGADVNAINNNKNTVFYETIYSKDKSKDEFKIIDTLDILLENGADINLNVEEGASTAIYYAACYAKSQTLTKYLLEKGADINKVSIGEEWTLINYINNDLQSKFGEEDTKLKLKEIYDFLISQGGKECSQLEGRNINILNTEKKSKEKQKERPREQPREQPKAKQKEIPHSEPNKKVINIGK